MPRASFSPSFYFHAEGHHMKSCNWVSRGSRNRSKGLCRKVTCCPSWEEKPAWLFRYQLMAGLPAAQVSSSLYITCCTQHIFNVRERSLENSCASALPQSPFPSGLGEEWHASRFTTGTRLLSCLSTFNLAQHVALLLLNKDLKSLISLHLRTAPLADGDGSRQQARGWRLHPACVAASWLCQTPQHSCSLETVLLTWNPPEKTKPDVPGSKDRIFFFCTTVSSLNRRRAAGACWGAEGLAWTLSALLPLLERALASWPDAGSHSSSICSRVLSCAT